MGLIGKGSQTTKQEKLETEREKERDCHVTETAMKTNPQV